MATGLGIKGQAVQVCQNWTQNQLLDVAVDCSRANAVLMEVFVSGSSPSATITVKGSQGAGGNYLTLPDLNATQTAVTASKPFDVIVGSRWVKIDISAVSGTFGQGQGYTIYVTPYWSPGSARVAASIVVNTLAAIQVLTGALTISDVLNIGANGGIYQGTGTFANPTTGLKVWNGGGVGRIDGYNGGTLQWTASTDGKLYARAFIVFGTVQGISRYSVADLSAYTVSQLGTE